MKLKLLSGLLAALVVASPSFVFDPFVVSDIRVEGIQRTEAGTVFSYLPVRVGETFTDAKAAEAIKDLFATGFFNDPHDRRHDARARGRPRRRGHADPVRVLQAWPDVIRAGVRYGEPGCWEVRLFGELARWSKLYEQCLLNTTIADRSCRGNPPPGKIVLIPRRWEDAVGVRVGGSWWASEDAELVLGLGYDGNAVPDKTIDPALYDTEKYTIALGGRFALSDSLNLSVTYTQVIYPDRTVAARTHRPGATTGDIESLGFTEPERSPDAAGTYKHAIGVLDVSVEATF